MVGAGQAGSDSVYGPRPRSGDRGGADGRRIGLFGNEIRPARDDTIRFWRWHQDGIEDERRHCDERMRLAAFTGADVGLSAVVAVRVDVVALRLRLRVMVRADLRASRRHAL